MYQIESKINTNSPEFKENKKYMQSCVKEFKERLEQVKKGGPPYMHEKHKARGKMFVRERLKLLFDPNTPFLELSALASYGMYDNEHASAGIITGIGVVHGKEVLVVANDATVKGGTYIPETIKKHIRAQEIAIQNRLPCVYLVDSGGIFLITSLKRSMNNSSLLSRCGIIFKIWEINALSRLQIEINSLTSSVFNFRLDIRDAYFDLEKSSSGVGIFSSSSSSPSSSVIR